VIVFTVIVLIIGFIIAAVTFMLECLDADLAQLLVWPTAR
jgi:hypothetical protein